MLNPYTGLTNNHEGSLMDSNGVYYREIYPSFSNSFKIDLEEEKVVLTPEQLAKIKQEIAEENARRAEMERKKSKLQKFFERYIHFF